MKVVSSERDEKTLQPFDIYLAASLGLVGGLSTRPSVV